MQQELRLSAQPIRLPIRALGEFTDDRFKSGPILGRQSAETGQAVFLWRGGNLLAFWFPPDWITGSADMKPAAQIFAVVIALLLVLGGLAALASLLGTGNNNEAFGLPPGTIRAVLAIGLLIAYVVFGLTQLEQLAGNTTHRVTIPVPVTELQDTANPPAPAAGAAPAEGAALAASRSLDLKRINDKRTQLERDGLLVIDIDEKADKENVLFVTLRRNDPDYSAFSRDILTMLGTLLASILSFYFGSRAVEQGLEASGRGQSSTTPKVLKSMKISFTEPNLIKDAAKGLLIFGAGDRLLVRGGANDGQVFTVLTVEDAQIFVSESSVKTQPAGTECTLIRQ